MFGDEKALPAVAVATTDPDSSVDVRRARSRRREQAGRAAATVLPVRPAFVLSAREFAVPSWDLVQVLIPVRAAYRRLNKSSATLR